MSKRNDVGSRTKTGRTQTDEDDVNLPNVPFMGIATFLGLLVIVLLGVAAYSISQTVDGFVLDSSLLAPLVFLLVTAALFWLVGRYDTRSYEP